MLGRMKNYRPPILEEIDAFLAEVPMGESYFGKRAVGNSEIVARLRGGGRIWPETIDRLRAFMGERRAASKMVGQRVQSRRGAA